MIPTDALSRIRSVNIRYDSLNCICGFSFFDKDGELLWKIGFLTGEGCSLETVMLAEHEVIVGVVAKPWEGYQTLYSDF